MKQFLRYTLTLVAILIATSNAWAQENLQYQWVERFNNTTTFDNDDLEKITTNSYTNHVKFSITNVTYYNTLGIKRLDYPDQKDDQIHSSTWGWEVETNTNNPYQVTVTKIVAAVRGYKNDGCTWAKARFNNNEWTSCLTSSLGESGSTDISIENNQGLGSSVTFYTQNHYAEQSWTNWIEDYATFTLHNIRYTYKVTQRVPEFQYKAIAVTNNSEYGSAYSSWSSFANATTSESTHTKYDPNTLSTTPGIAQTVYFKAVPKTGYNFVGWKKSLDATTYESYDMEYSLDFTSTSNDKDKPSTITLYAVFNAQKDPRFDIQTTAAVEVGKTIYPTFTFDDVANAPTSDTSKKFHFIITHTPDATTKEGSDDPSKVISYNPTDNSITGLNSGTAKITFIHEETNDYFGQTQECVVTVSKQQTSLSLNLQETYFVDDEDNTVYTTNHSDVTVLVSDKTSDNRALFTYSNGILKANGDTLNADSETTTITVTQPETYKWTGKTLTQQVWVKKHEVRAHINPSTAVWNDIVKNPFSASSTHKVAGTVTPINGFYVAQEDNAHIGQLDPNTYNIQTYHTSGTAHFRVTRPADRKYQALNQVVGLTVGQSSETCPLTIYNYSSANGQTTYDSNKEYAVGYYDDPSGFLFDLSDAGDILSLDVRKQGLAVDDSYLYVIGYDEKGQNETTLMTLSNRNDITTNYTTHTCTISDITETRITRILVKSSSSDIWNDALAKFFKNIRVTRKQYLEPQITGKDFYLTQASIRMNFEGTFILDWSTCADEILLTCDNPSFVITPSVIDASEQKSGSTPITITCRDENATNLVGKVTIYDQMQQTDFYVHCKYLLQHIVWDQYFNNLETDEAGYIAFNQTLNAYAATVDGTPTGAPITYTLDENAKKIAHLETTNGVTTLHITGQGDGKITASVQAFEKDGRTYSADEVTRDIRVRKYGDLCNTIYHLSDGFNLFTIQTSESFNIQGMNAGTLLFNAYKDWYGVNYFYVQFSTDNEVSWSDKHIELDSENKDYTVLIPDGTTHLRFVTKTGATFYKYISNIYVKQKMELTPDTKQINETIYVNTPYERTIRVTYSDIPAIQTNLTQNTTNRLLLTPNQPVINNCGDFGTYDYTLSGEWSQPQTVTETLQFFTSAGLPQTVNITLHIIMHEEEVVSIASGSWSDPNTWNTNTVPQAYHNVRIEHQLTISSEAEAHSLTIAQGATISITSQGGLTIYAGGFTTHNTSADIILDNLQTGAGYLRISPQWQGTKPKVKVRYQTKSTLDTGANQDATWQYIGAPGANCQFTVDYITWLYQWSEPQNWINKTGTLTLEPFAGYAITQYGKPTYELIAEPINQNQTIQLTKTESGMNGNNLFANSFMAPIDAKNFTPEDFSDYNTGRDDIVKTFYLFNSGSWNDWNKYTDEESKGSNGNDTPGQYCAIPALASQFLNNDYDITTLPPMQGIYMIANNPAEIYLNYEKHVWKANSTADLSTDMHEPMRTPQRTRAQEQMQQDSFRRIRLQLNSANSGADRLYIIQTDETTPNYDNGYDAPNQTVTGLTNIYTTESFGKMEVSCSNHIDSMYIGFQAGSDTQYTLSFSSLIGDMLYLEDLEQDTIVAMQQDMPYTFTATALSINDYRFRLLLSPKGGNNSPTDTEDINNVSIWMDNNVLHITGTPANSTLQIYNVSGAHILTQAISDTPYIYNLSHLSAGVYLIRINNYTYKVIKK